MRTQRVHWAVPGPPSCTAAWNLCQAAIIGLPLLVCHLLGIIPLYCLMSIALKTVLNFSLSFLEDVGCVSGRINLATVTPSFVETEGPLEFLYLHSKVFSFDSPNIRNLNLSDATYL